MGHDHHAIHQMGFVHLLSFQIWSALLSALCTAGCSATQVISTCSPRGRTAITRASRSEEHTSELQSLMRISYAVFCLKKKKQTHTKVNTIPNLHKMTIN